MPKRNSLKAYSIMEIVIILGLFFGIIAVLLPVGVRELQVNRAQTAAFDIESALNLMQSNSYTGLDGKDYGIKLEADRYITYTGSDYINLETSDEFLLTLGVNISNINLIPVSTDINFDTGNLQANVSGSFDIGTSEQLYRVHITEQGLIYTERL
jgi:hypothetical protein